MTLEKELKELKECRIWVILTLLFLTFFMIQNDYGDILTLIYGTKLKCNKVVLDIGGNYITVPKKTKNDSNVIGVGTIYKKLCIDPVCFVFDFSKANYNSKKEKESNYDFIKRNWLRKGYLLRKREINKIRFDEWYVFESDKTGYTILIFPDYEISFSLFNGSYIDDLLKHIKFKVKKGKRKYSSGKNHG